MSSAALISDKRSDFTMDTGMLRGQSGVGVWGASMHSCRGLLKFEGSLRELPQRQRGPNAHQQMTFQHGQRFEQLLLGRR